MQNPLLNLIKPYAVRDLNTMRELIANEVGKSIDINEQSISGATVLHWAVGRWYFDLAKLALQKGANSNIRDVEGNSALHIASHSGDSLARMISLLLQYGAEVNTGNMRSYTPLHLAAERGYIKSVELLVAKGADVNAVTSYGSSVLSYALKKLQKETQNGNSYLIRSCTQIVQLLKDNDAKE